MDRRNAFRFLSAALTLATAAVAAERTADVQLNEARWIAAGRDPVRALTVEPEECLALPREPQQRRSIEIGRAAFRYPLLLGGVAARVGLACAACHRSGHGNPDFNFPGLSGAPGTADTTSAVTSEQRDDGLFNPKPIPSLVEGESKPTVSRGRNGELEHFIHGLIVEEFDGPEPPSRVVAGLADYVRALRYGGCSLRSRRITVAGRAGDAARALDAATFALEAGDRETARTMIASARSTLGEIVERLEPPAPAAARDGIQMIGAELGRLQGSLSSKDIIALRRRLLLLTVHSGGSWEALTLYDPKRLAAALHAG